MMKECLSEINTRNSLQKSKRTGNLVDRVKYNRACNKVTHLKKNFKNDYFIATFEEASHDLPKLWRLIKQLLGGKKSRLEIK